MDGMWLKFAEIAAWPAVALVGIVILGPGKLLERVLAQLTGAVVDLNRAVDDFKKTTINMKSDVSKFDEIFRSISSEFTGKIDKIQDQLYNTSRQLDDISAKAERTLSSSNAVLTEIVAGGDTEIDEVPMDANQEESQQTAPTPLLPEEMYRNITIAWENLVADIEAALEHPTDFDRRKIGDMARRLSDGRYKKKIQTIPESASSHIANLHSLYKRFARLQSTKDTWLNADLYQSFIYGVESARANISIRSEKQ